MGKNRAVGDTFDVRYFTASGQSIQIDFSFDAFFITSGGAGITFLLNPHAVEGDTHVIGDTGNTASGASPITITPALGQTINGAGGSVSITAPGSSVQLTFSSLLGGWVMQTFGAGGGVTPSNGFIFVRPIDGVTDDWPSLFDVIFPIALALGAAVVMLPGLAGQHFVAKSRRQVPSGLHLIGTPQTQIDADFTGFPPSILNAPFDMVSPTTGSFNVSANNTPGTRIVQVSGSPGGGWVNGSWIQLQVGAAHLHGNLFQIVSSAPVAGGKFNLTLDRTVLYTALAANAIVVQIVGTPVSNIFIEGNGMQCNGGPGIVEVQGGMNIRVEGLVFNGTAVSTGGAGLLFDTFSLQCKAKNLTCNCNNFFANGIWIIGEGHEVRDIISRDAVTNGIIFADVAASSLTNFEIYDSAGIGLTLTSDGVGNGSPTGNVAISDGTIFGCAGDGVAIDQAGFAWVLTNILAQFNGAGCHIAAGSPLGPPVGVKLMNCNFPNNTVQGLLVEAGVKKTFVSGLDISGNATGIEARDDLIAYGVISRTGNNSQSVLASGGDQYYSGFDLTLDNVNGGQVFNITGANVTLDNGHATIASTVTTPPQVIVTSVSSTIVLCVKSLRVTFNAAAGAGLASINKGKTTWDNIDVDGTQVAAAGGISPASGTTIRLGERVALDPLAVAFVATAGSHYSKSGPSFGPVTLTGTTPVVIAWPDLTSADQVKITRRTTSGASGALSVTQTLATSFSVVSDNVADDGTFDYEIS